MADSVATPCSPEVATGHANSQLFNTKQLQDFMTLAGFSVVLNSIVIGQQAVIDNQVNARQRMTNAASADNAQFLNNLTSDQTGQTQNQQGNTPSRTAAADATFFQPAGAGYPPNRTTDTMGSTAAGGVQANMLGILGIQQSIDSALAAFQAGVNNITAQAMASFLSNLTKAAAPAPTGAAS